MSKDNLNWTDGFAPLDDNEIEIASYQDLILDLVRQERIRQTGMWSADFDGENTANDWIAYINQYASRSAIGKWNPGMFEDSMIKVAAIAMAALEVFYINNGDLVSRRHFDG